MLLLVFEYACRVMQNTDFRAGLLGVALHHGQPRTTLSHRIAIAKDVVAEHTQGVNKT